MKITNSKMENNKLECENHRIKMENSKLECKTYEELTFKGLTKNDTVTFENKTPKIQLVNIFNPILRIEKCTWLDEFETKY